MAMTTSQRGLGWSRLHFVLRFVGLTGLIMLIAGLAIAFLVKIEPQEGLQALQGRRGPRGMTAAILLSVGLVALALALVFELYVHLFKTTSRRNVAGLLSVLQIALVLGLLIGANVYSFGHYLRFDWTRNHQFTLPAELRAEFPRLNGQTTVVVYLHHKRAGNLTDAEDAKGFPYESAAEAKVVEKVRDLVEQFREFGPQFKVVTLDTHEVDFEERLEDATTDKPALRAALGKAKENMIFFSAGDDDQERVRELGFDEFYQLDKTASQHANEERGNLVLIPQGDKPEDQGAYTRGARTFARKVLNIDERRPRVLVAVVHPFLTTEGPRKEWSMSRARKALEAAGFEVEDVILRKTTPRGQIMDEGVVFTYDESRRDQLERLRASRTAKLKRDQLLKDKLPEALKEWKNLSLKELSDKYAAQVGVREISEEIRRFQLERLTEYSVALPDVIEDDQAKLKETEEEMAKLKAESLAEKQRLPDLKARMDRTLQDFDLIIIPRVTILDAPNGFYIENDIHRLKEAQVNAIKDFLKAGKSALVCFGPLNVPQEMQFRPGQPPMPPRQPVPDELENLFSELGLKFGSQTVLYEVEIDSFLPKEEGGGPGGLAGKIEVPPVRFDADDEKAVKSGGPDSIRQSMDLISRSLGENEPLAVRIRYPRTIEVDQGKIPGSASAATIMRTVRSAVKETDPFNPSQLAPDKNTLPAEKGPFSIGVALERPVPETWYDNKKQLPQEVRVAAIGNGGLFVDDETTQAKERLLVDTCNWLVGRDDHLAHDSGARWQYPRLAMSEQTKNLWVFAMWVGLPALFLYLGCIVLMIRGLR
jgi:hypothetical protein